jgi:hypothetical protein
MTETMTSRPRKAAPVDAVCRDAVDAARAAILELVPADHVGEHLGVVAEDDRVVTHRFVSGAPGYRGWQWAVTVARAPRARGRRRPAHDRGRPAPVPRMVGPG